MSAVSGVRRLALDSYHAGLRLAALGWWLAAAGGLFFGGLGLIGLIAGQNANWLWLPWLIISLLLSQAIGRWGEAQLLRRWPSGRALELAGARLVLQEPAGTQTFDLERKVNFWRWNFVIRDRRGGRVSNGHVCCALRLVQDAGAAAGPAASAHLYAFLPPAEAAGLLARFPSYELRRAKEAGAGAALPAGREPVFLAAEHERWDAGAELSAADFTVVLEHLAAHLPGFTGSPMS